MKVIGIIPARYGSTRFPGKPLADVDGKPMIQRVYEQAKKCPLLSEVVVATDDIRIETVVKQFKGNVVMTSTHHESGTDRCDEALKIIGNAIYDVVINIQGDEPFIHPDQVLNVIACFKDKNVTIASLAKKITTDNELDNVNTIKVVMDKNKDALYFSRTALPYYNKKDRSDRLKFHTYYKHVGIYGYRTNTLLDITQLKRSPLEIAESLEQLRWIENGYKIRMELTDHEAYSIDTPEDLKQAIDFFSAKK